MALEAVALMAPARRTGRAVVSGTAGGAEPAVLFINPI